jgi:hypothetical protein
MAREKQVRICRKSPYSALFFIHTRLNAMNHPAILALAWPGWKGASSSGCDISVQNKALNRQLEVGWQI